MPSTYQHIDNEYFRIGRCLNCDQDTFHKPLEFQRSSGRTYTIWKCEYCEIESEVFLPAENEMAIFIQYVRQRYIVEKQKDELSESH